MTIPPAESSPTSSADAADTALAPGSATPKTPDVAIVFCGGADAGLTAGDLPSPAYVVAADSGLRHAAAIGVDVDLAVGDFDSVSARELLAVESAGAEIRRHQPDKDATDLELALEAAVDAGVRQIVVVGALGGRLDHELANLLLLASDRWRDVAIELRDAEARLYVVRGRRTLTGSVGDTVTLLAVGGPASGVTISGVRWPLTDARLEPGSSLGVSNEFESPLVALSVAEGVVLAVHPR